MLATILVFSTKRGERTFNPGLRPTYSTERGRTLACTALWFSS